MWMRVSEPVAGPPGPGRSRDSQEMDAYEDIKPVICCQYDGSRNFFCPKTQPGRFLFDRERFDRLLFSEVDRMGAARGAAGAVEGVWREEG